MSNTVKNILAKVGGTPLVEISGKLNKGGAKVLAKVEYFNPGGSVKVNVTQKSGEVLLSVQDTGIGISPEHQDKVFERFYRVDKSHSKQSGGTGLGLSIVKHAVQYHHGKITVESELNKGTTISVLFDTRA